jgi:negative regulator of sigma-B (phosphoserine phosphatase)
METLRPRIEWGIAALPLPGHDASGDGHLVKAFPNGVLVAVVDGLGHGPEAAEAAAIAIHTLDKHSEQSVISLAKRCHDALRSTRGVAMSLASYTASDSTLTWLAVGNVEGVLLRGNARAQDERESLVLRGGVLGTRLPSLSADSLTVAGGELLILATDGIDSGFAETLVVTDPPQTIADRILAGHRRATDDALVLVARFLPDEADHL